MWKGSGLCLLLKTPRPLLNLVCLVWRVVSERVVSARSHLQGGTDVTDDPNLTSKVLHPMYIILSIKPRDHKGQALFFRPWPASREYQGVPEPSSRKYDL